MVDWSLVLNAKFFVAALACAAFVTTVKRAISYLPGAFEKGWVKAVLTMLNLAAGALVAVPKFLAGNTYGERLMLGLTAGLLSVFIYHLLLKRLGGVRNGQSDDSADVDVTAAPGPDTKAP